MAIDESMKEEFVIEAQEHLETVEDDILQLAQQKDGLDKELIDKVFRSVHSVKGGAGFLQLKQLGRLTHVMETLLSTIRAGELQFEPHVVDGLLAGLDLLNTMLENVDESNDMDIDEIHDRLTRILEGGVSEETRSDLDERQVTGDQGQDLGFEINRLTLKNLPVGHSHLYVLRYDLTEFDREQGKTPVALIKELMGIGHIVDSHITPCLEDFTCGVPEGPLLCRVLFSTMLGPDFIDMAVGLPQEKITVVDKNKYLAEVPGDAGQAPEAADDEFDMPVTPEMVEQYILESDELLEQAEGSICEILERGGGVEENLNEAFRLIHSFKGNSGLLGYKDFERLSHKLEEVLEIFKMRENPTDETGWNVLLKGIDALRTGLSRLSKENKAQIPECAELIETVGGLMRSPGAPKGKKPQKAKEGDLADKGAAKAVERRDIRVDLERLDSLINLVGELVIAESMVTRNQDLAGLNLENFERSAHNLRRIIADLQDVAMAVRMVPLSRTFRRMIRLVHDLSRKAGKKVSLELVGEDTEVDKTVIELIADPLVHVIRNSVDHGLETTDDRVAAGKPETGSVVIEAKHEGGEVLIRVTDDGRGLSREKILKKALEKGLVKGDPAGMSDDEVYRLIFAPGFSTADQVTDVSGRGVGMDVVKRNLENLKGRVDIRSKPGKGAQVTLRIPLTLAIIDGMLVRVGGSRFTIPLLSIRESFRPTTSQITVTMDGQEVVRVREDLIPVVRLHELYGTEPDERDLDKGILVMVSSGARCICLFLDEILEHHQAVIKGLPDYIGTARGISGCTILGDGRVSLILDVGSLIDMAEQVGGGDDKKEAAEGLAGR